MSQSANPSIIITPTDPYTAEAQELIAELSAALETITGNSGRHSFQPSDVCVPRAIFVVARDRDGTLVGCGAFRPMTATVAEVKRMYARVKTQGVGSAVLRYLETAAVTMDYTAFRLETRLVNQKAVAFYERHGYRRIPNYGHYIGHPESVCFEKELCM